jgi:hypothetical protein
MLLLHDEPSTLGTRRQPLAGFSFGGKQKLAEGARWAIASGAKG